MTEDASPENLRKFLESDDLAMVMMGLSMAKGIEISSTEIYPIANLYMWHEDTSIRRTAKTVFMKNAPEKAKEIMKTHWKTQYRNATLPPLKNMIKELRTEKMKEWASKIQNEADVKVKKYINTPNQNIVGKKYQKVLDASPKNPYYEDISIDMIQKQVKLQASAKPLVREQAYEVSHTITNALEILGHTIISERWNRPWYYAGVAGFIGDIDDLEVLDKLLNIIELYQDNRYIPSHIVERTIITLGNRFHALAMSGNPNYGRLEKKFQEEIIFIYNKIKKNEKDSNAFYSKFSPNIQSLLNSYENFEDVKADERYNDLNKQLQKQAKKEAHEQTDPNLRYSIAIALSKCSITKESGKIISKIAELIMEGQDIDAWDGNTVSKRKDFRSNYKYKYGKEHGLKCSCSVHNDYWATYECMHIIEIVSLLEIWQGLEK